MFVSFEGPEGAGKTTLISGLADLLRSRGLEVMVTREPGAGAIGSAIREILLHGDELDPKSELFLFLADRAHHVASVIRPTLDRGAWVLCDRYADSTIVYQGYGRGLAIDMLREWNRFATGDLMPDITLFLDLEPEVGLSRIVSKDRLDSESLDFHRRVRAGFRAEADREPNRWIVLDAAKPQASVLEEATAAIGARTRI